MRQYADLNEDEKVKAFDKGLVAIMTDINETGDVFFPELEEYIKEAQRISEDFRTPWFFNSILYQDVEGAKEIIGELVQVYIEDALYPENGEYTITL